MNKFHIKRAAKLQTKVIFVSTTTKNKSAAKILNWCFSK